uniref:Ig-like domain-containing protein n=1 Tax=Sarcophilus harrisii TaxID=9305 RepID=A0A7N4PGJ2_SARHA
MVQLYFWFSGLFLLFMEEAKTAKENTDPIMVMGILGESAILPAEIPLGKKLVNINWSSRTPVAIVQPDPGTSFKLIITHQNYVGRLNVISLNYDLKISPLKMEDAGSYRADINVQADTTSTMTITKNYLLHVYRRLAPPKITQNSIISKNNTCNITLTCFAEGGEDVKYQWTPLEEQAIESNGKSSLFIYRRPEDAHINYTCTVTNPVSNNSESILVHLCAETTSLSSLRWLIPVLSSIVLIVAGTCFYLQYKKKKDADSLSIFQSKNLPEDNQVYDELSMPTLSVSNQKKEAPNTIYCTVQNPQKMENS